MTKSQNTKNEQQKDLRITNEQLTEQCKKGELPEGWYYVEDNRVEDIYAYTAEYLNNMYRPRSGERIIEQVPSYEEWDKLNNACHELEKETACLTVDIVKLKELLKECRDEIDYLRKHYKGNIDHFKNNTRLDKEINQALGEDE